MVILGQIFLLLNNWHNVQLEAKLIGIAKFYVHSPVPMLHVIMSKLFQFGSIHFIGCIFQDWNAALVTALPKWKKEHIRWNPPQFQQFNQLKSVFIAMEIYLLIASANEIPIYFKSHFTCLWWLLSFPTLIVSLCPLSSFIHISCIDAYHIN